MKDFKKLKVWEKAHKLTLGVYKATEKFPKDEMFGLTSQLRRSAASIPANIAEGYGRGSDPELMRYLRISFGSATELEYHLILAQDLGYLSPEYYQQLSIDLTEVQKMLSGFSEAIKKD